MSSAVIFIEDLPGIPPECSFAACAECRTAMAVAVPFTVTLPWQTEGVALLALFRVDSAGEWQSISVFEDSAGARTALLEQSDDEALRRWLAQQGIGWFLLDSPLTLMPVHIPKPWGEEIWFTGIEQRGVSQAVPVSGKPVPLHWLLLAMPEYFLGPDAGSWPVLLKILSPLPDEGLGDLYLELHEEKREVYIVTGVDSRAWSDGVGAIRLGVNPEIVARYDCNAAFRDAFVGAALAYEAHRREVDEWIDLRRSESGLPDDELAPPAWRREQLASQPADWSLREIRLREALESFTRLQALQVGDVVQVPLLVPHSLQHGVRAVEFQTPVYERKVLAFGQKVLTQAHWDCSEGVALMSLEPASLPELPVIEQSPEQRVEQVVSFEDFSVHRIHLGAGQVRQAAAGRYRLFMGLSGCLDADAVHLGAEQAWFWPAALPLAVVSAQDAENTVFLEAVPA